MNENSDESPAVRLTARGVRTRARIVTAAAELMYVQGIGGTTLDDVIVASGASKSQFYRHFDDKHALVRAVVAQVGEDTIIRETNMLGNVSTLAGLRRWRDALVKANALRHGMYGCPLGSLANEVSDHDALARSMLEELFGTWQRLLNEALDRMKDTGVLAESADTTRLAVGFLASLQGGYLLAQTARDVEPMATAIDVALSHLESLTVQSRAAS
ncbi:TetR/AcrR family transcriptional regulator [Myceligenerans pegani]|uniref:TetR/AcrR family transcriptional regulator n=1 Tax=Myceligenerans pegani TaxID=2776917 RepID=A0ABR9MYT3_9MICO|nr:TetR/AcrR family transcriptional regulator [Myceligenerans sp. TRM 65318]MBE1876552.1 TetR/AcrR family transcriptional regulator [Myceligenerans sp. TRM 65318]MBE3018823.1 TetR/AcrR family transcriptional regulator [Myceligenerans sp. TRM 65318]